MTDATTSRNQDSGRAEERITLIDGGPGVPL